MMFGRRQHGGVTTKTRFRIGIRVKNSYRRYCFSKVNSRRIPEPTHIVIIIIIIRLFLTGVCFLRNDKMNKSHNVHGYAILIRLRTGTREKLMERPARTQCGNTGVRKVYEIVLRIKAREIAEEYRSV